MSWRDELREPSFRGVPFKLDANARIGGRRGFTYEFAKSERSSDEDLGRRVTRATVSGYVIGEDCLEQADDLEAALNTEGGGMLVLPTMGQAVMRCESFQRVETKDTGGMVRFEMAFVRSQYGTQAGGSAGSAPTDNPQAKTGAAALNMADAAEQSAGKPSSWKGGT